MPKNDDKITVRVKTWEVPKQDKMITVITEGGDAQER
jgi:hypothetical protein